MNNSYGKLTKTYVITSKSTADNKTSWGMSDKDFYTKEEACDELKEMIKRFLSVHESVDILEQREDYFEASYKGGYIRLSVSD